MRRVLLVFGVTLAILLQSGSASADWHSMKAKWHCFWDRVHLDWHRNNAWPEPFLQVDRQSVDAPIAIMVDKGWQLENTIPDELFDVETQELTRAGQLKVQRILTEMPSRRRMVFVLRGNTPDVTQTRFQSVETAAIAVAGEAAPSMIAISDARPRGGSGAYYERVTTGYETTTPSPRLPAMTEAGEGG